MSLSPLNAPLTTPGIFGQRLLQVALLVLLMAASLGLMGLYPWQPVDPYVKTVLANPGTVQKGRAIFQMNCAVCHGLEGKGNVGPSLKQVSSRKSPHALIEQVISGRTPPMPQFQPSPQEMADLLSYLQAL